MTFDELRVKYPVFRYRSFEIVNEKGRCRVTYTFEQSDDLVFRPTWLLPYSFHDVKNDPTVYSLVFSLGLVELISYWKACCSPRVEILCGSLDGKQTAWWKKLWFNGLGEFFYRNGITTNIDGFMTVVSSGPTFTASSKANLQGNLICVGGGKDSAVTMDLLQGRNNRLYTVNGSASVKRTIETAGYSERDIIVFERSLDRKIVELNLRGYLNGHTPFSAILAFSAVLCAYLDGRKYVVLSNESSSNDVYVKGTDVNHQYSKSLEFENDFRAYLSDYIPCGVVYFSLLRPLNEWNICKRFVEIPGQLESFLSCNLGQKTDRWCCQCPKCLFTYVMMSAFVDQARLTKVFGKNLLDDDAMTPYLDGLVCDQFDKPFECIGTREEINAAFRAAIRRNGADFKLLKQYREKYMSQPVDEPSVDSFFDENNNVPDEFAEVFSWKRN